MLLSIFLRFYFFSTLYWECVCRCGILFKRSFIHFRLLSHSRVRTFEYSVRQHAHTQMYKTRTWAASHSTNRSVWTSCIFYDFTSTHGICMCARFNTCERTKELFHTSECRFVRIIFGRVCVWVCAWEQVEQFEQCVCFVTVLPLCAECHTLYTNTSTYTEIHSKRNRNTTHPKSCVCVSVCVCIRSNRNSDIKAGAQHISDHHCQTPSSKGWFIKIQEF